MLNKRHAVDSYKIVTVQSHNRNARVLLVCSPFAVLAVVSVCTCVFFSTELLRMQLGAHLLYSGNLRPDYKTT